MTSKIHVKVGAVEMDFEGESDFLKSDILPILNQLLSKPDLHEESIELDKPNGSNPPPSKPDFTEESYEQIGMNSIVAKLDVKTGSDLIIAACAYLYFMKKKGEYSRIDILNTMKEANHTYDKNDSKNLSQNLKAIVKSGKLNEKKAGVYTLPQIMINNLRSKFAG